MKNFPSHTSSYRRIFQTISGAVLLLALTAAPGLRAQTIWNNVSTGDWTVSGNWSSGVPTGATDATVNNGGNATLSGTGAVNELKIGSGSGTSGSLSFTGGTLSVSGNSLIGFYGSTGTATASGGTWSTGSLFFVGSSGGTGSLTISGGSVVSSNSSIGHGGNGTVTVSSGSWSAGSLYVGNDNGQAGAGVLTISGGTVTASTVFLDYSYGYATSTGTVNLNGGVLATGGITKLTDGGHVNFAGGTLRATGSNADILSGFASGDVQIATGGAVIDTQAFNVGLSTVLQGAGGLTKQGNGTLTLSGNNSYGGDTTVTGGLINFSIGENLGTGNITLDHGGLQWATGNTLDISSRLNPFGPGGATFDTNGNGVTFSTGLSGNGGLTKLGAGTLTLDKINTYSGGTTVNTGTLAVDAGTQLYDINNVASGTTHGTLGTGPTTVNGDSGSGAGTLQFLSNASAGSGTFTNSGGTVAGIDYFSGSGGGITQFKDTSTASYGTFNNYGGTTAGSGYDSGARGGGTIFSGGSISEANVITLGATADHGIFNNYGSTYVHSYNTPSAYAGYTQFSGYSTAGNGTFNNFGISATLGNGGYTYFSQNSTAGNGIFNSYGGTIDPTIYDGGGHPIAWNTNDGGHVVFSDNSTAGDGQFYAYAGTASGAAMGSISFQGSSTAGNGTFILYGATVVGTGGGQLMFSGNSTAGIAHFEINGNDVSDPFHFAAASLMFQDSASADHGIFTVNGGTVTGENGGANGGQIQFGAGTTADHGQFTNNAGGDGNAMGGSTIFFGGTADQGTFINNGGTVWGAGGGYTQFSSSSAAANSTLIANGGTYGANGGAIFFSGDSTGDTATVKVYDNGLLDINGHNSGVMIGSLEGSGQVFLGANNLTVGNDTSTTFSGVIQDGTGWFYSGGGTGGSLTKIGTGTLTLSGANAYTGGTTVDGISGNSTLAAGADNVFGTGPMTVNGNGNTATLDLNGYNQTVGALAGDAAGVVSLRNASLTVDQTGSSTEFAGVITGTGGSLTAMDSSGDGILTLSGANTYDGGTIVEGSGGNITVTAGAENVFGTGPLAINGNSNTATVHLNGYSQTVASLAGDSFSRVNLADGAVLTAGGANTSTQFDGSMKGSGGLVKTGSGTLTLTGASTYSGLTNISDGTVLINNTSGSVFGDSAVTVDHGATLAGGGGFSGTLALNGLLSPGNEAPGTLSASTTTFGGGGSFLFQINSVAPGGAGQEVGWDLLSISGALNIAATSGSKFAINVTSLTSGNTPGALFDFDPSSSYTFTLATTTTGISFFDPNAFFLSFAGFINSSTGTWSIEQGGIDGNDLNLVYSHGSAVPEPATYAAIFGCAVLGFALWRRRRLAIAA